ncbi:MAG: ABC transporter ATP-binding protein [Patescibacteria group bacterium]|nr:ABC transporter ATP-binding protein/permease [Patescibacteria group bacterium]MDE1988678.1 ABC transporter ATP-binding protein [Patescibacteria group bacterium]MDE2218477.1 ABC transporter ATP-binding protein [Patescibacteria group bacterium]
MKKKTKKEKLFAGWKVVQKYLLENKRSIVLISVLGIISALANGSVPYIVGRFFDALITPFAVFDGTTFTMPAWLLFIALFGLVQITANIVDWENDKRSRKIGTFVHADYPHRAVSALLRLPLSFHKEHKTGEVWDKIIRAGNAISQIIEQVIIPIAPQILGVCVSITITFIIKPTLALVLLGGLGIYIATLARIVPPIAKFQRKGNKAWNKAYGDAYDAFANTQTIKQATAEIYEDKKIYRRFILNAATLWYNVEKIWSGISFYQRIIVTVTQITIFLLAVSLVTRGNLTIGELIAFNGYAAMVFGPFVRIGNNWQVIQNGLVAIDRADEILSTPAEHHYTGGAEKPKKYSGNIEFKNVFFSYGKSGGTVLDDINVSIKQGEIVALVGESGGGKSTFIDLVSGYYFPKKGKILVDGVDTRNIDLGFHREHIAVVPQEVVLFNDTIGTNIRYGNFLATDDLMKEAARKAHADIFIESFPKKYNQMVGERGVKLSVGQKQRIAIARAILRDPRILILDEPTSALDSQTERFITNSLEELMRGRTTLIVAHRLSTVRKANRILVLDKGRIIESGTHDELMQILDGRYRHMYEYHIGLE